MKAFLSILLFFVSLMTINAQSLGIVESNNYADIHNLFNQQDITIHFYQDNFAIISGDYNYDLQYSLLEKNGFNTEYKYFIQYANEFEIPISDATNTDAIVMMPAWIFVIGLSPQG